MEDEHELARAVALGAVKSDAAEHVDRLLAMLHDNGQTWDLSPNDKSAIRWAMDELYRLNVELSTWRRESVEEIARLRHELKAQREGMGREIGRLAEACEVANKALSLAWTDLCEWRQFARYNTLGEVCGEPRPIPDPPQRPTKAGLAATELVIGEVMDAIRVVRKLSSPEAHPAPGGEGRETD